ncbi:MULTISPECIES: hypothetical protein [Streptomyces]|uniref:Secreted protein n=1 Tax=Streptomyces europaeiscabiei TaxID=146819 RepID=A0ABU4NQX9_9ACTN|nr:MULTISPECIES: hypothetical protein [Streptomyces]MBP5922133.1 hypothetical protein [Streptomyces sp. LBUM 1483]MDX3555234.1 hypothetical protein [Streptomyces europaeiscabiei]MDX3705248.1 hypothetical protein [Streptomyces europaeiscabiei]MDX3864340.1 hypothetical protein [Streptomyces europaeiscabiei]MDX3871578.1 hypothetical protein [Streptomyces europaeiscabiei]
MALWLVITGSALGTGIVLWLLKLLIDADSDHAPEQSPAPAEPVPARPIWPVLPAPHAHTTTCTGETLTLTALQPSRARHAKPRTAA